MVTKKTVTTNFDFFFVTDYPQVGCSDFDTRLAFRGQRNGSGNLEVCFNNEWTTVCATSFDQSDLNVTCRSLSFTSYERAALPVVHLTRQTNISLTPAELVSPILEFGFQCTGTESSLSECPRVTRGPDDVCTHSMDVRVDCLGKKSQLIRHHYPICS